MSGAGQRSQLSVRVVSGVVLVVALIALLLAGVWGVRLLVVAAGGAALWEFSRISERLGYRAPLWMLFPLGFCFAFSGTLLQKVPLSVILSAALVFGLCAFLFLPKRSGGLGGWAMGLAGAIYIGLPLNYYLLLYGAAGFPTNLFWVLLPIATVVVSDSAAYLVGRTWGRHKLMPEVSPNKSVEGAIAGLVFSAPVMLLGGTLLLHVDPWHAAVLGLLVYVVAVLGDLVESQMKRLADVKDSSHLIPGHGGVLDRLDSLLFPPVVVYLYASLFHLL